MQILQDTKTWQPKQILPGLLSVKPYDSGTVRHFEQHRPQLLRAWNKLPLMLLDRILGYQLEHNGEVECGLPHHSLTTNKPTPRQTLSMLNVSHVHPYGRKHAEEPSRVHGISCVWHKHLMLSHV